MRLCILLLLLITHQSTELPASQSDEEVDRGGDVAKKIIGSSVVTSVSVILNGNEPQFTDAVGKPIPKPMIPLQVASPINLLNPDRYEFYTFDDNGELVKRLMTLKEIQSIVANGDGDGAAIIHNVPIDDRDPEKNVHDIVQSVQNVLTKEVEWKKNASKEQLVLDTPDVSSSWSMILPAIFGNTGGDIFPHKPQQVVMTPDSDVVEHSSKPTLSKPTPSYRPKPTKQRVPTKRRPINTRKPITNAITDMPQKIFVNNEEIVRPTTINRVETTTSELLSEPNTSENSKISSTSTTTKRVPATKIKPSQYSSLSTSKRTTAATATTTSAPSSTIWSTRTTATPTTSTRTTIRTTSTTAMPTTTIKTTPIPEGVSTIKMPTVRVPIIHPETIPVNLITRKTTTKTTPLPTTTLSSTTPLTTTTSATTSSTSTKKATNNTYLFDESSTEIKEDWKINRAPIYTSTTEMDDELTSPSNDDVPTTLGINNILQSLTHNQEDLNTKLSFDQIMESLKDVSNDNDMPEETYVKKNQSTTPILYNGVNILSTGSNHHPTTELMETTGPSISSEGDQDDLTTTTEVDFQSITDKSTDNQLDKSNVIKFEPLYAELIDPILTDLTTEFLTTELPTTAMMEEMSELEELEQIYPTKTTNLEENEVNHIAPVAVQLINNVQSSNNLTQTVNDLIASNMDNFEDVSLSPQNFELVMESLKADNVNMSDFKQQAATAASILENLSIASSSSSPEVPTELDSSDEIESLLSDVLNQMADTPPTIKDEILKQEETSNRLSNVAHISTGLFGNLNRDDLKYEQSDSEDKKYEKLDTITPQEGSNFYKNQTSSFTSKIPVIKETSTMILNSDNSNEGLSRKPIGYAPVETLLSANKQKPEITMKPLTSTKEQQQSEYMETTSLIPVVRDEPATTELPVNIQELASSTLTETVSKYGSDKEETSSYPSPTTESYVEEKDSIENHTTESDSGDDDEKFSLISTTLMFSKEEQDNEDKENGSKYETIEIETNDSSTTAESVDGENSSAIPSENLMESSTSAALSITEDKTVSDYSPTPITDIFNNTETEHLYVRLGESTEKSDELISTTSITGISEINSNSMSKTVSSSTVRTPGTLKPVQYFKQPSPNDHKLLQFNSQRPLHNRPPSLSNLKINQQNQSVRPPVKLDPTPEQTMGLEASTLDLQEDVQEFARLCNELAFSYWKAITAEKISPARSLVLSPFALTSMLSMVFLGARGGTSGEMNEILKLDDMVTFNPHLVFKNITDSVEHATDIGISSSAFIREIYSDRSNGKILQFFKEKTQQLYSGHVEEVNFHVVNDIIRRRTNLLIKRHTMGKVIEYLRTNSVWVNGPLATVSANLFQTDCSKGSVYERDGEMFFQVHPSIRQRRLVPIPAVVFRGGFTAGYDTELDATVVAFGNIIETISIIYIMPGQQGLAAPGDNLERLEHNLVDTAITKNSWSRLLTSLMERPGLEVQLPRFSHRSFINASMGLQRMGLKTLFNSDDADLRGLTGLSNKDVYLSDMVQINTFSTCAEEKITDHHHVEMYPAPPLRRRNAIIEDQLLEDPANIQSDFTAIVNSDNARAFYDDLLNPKYLELPLPLRPRQARIPDAPRLRFDKPFLYFVRHNPTGMILFMGRFNPRLLP